MIEAYDKLVVRCRWLKAAEFLPKAGWVLVRFLRDDSQKLYRAKYVDCVWHLPLEVKGQPFEWLQVAYGWADLRGNTWPLEVSRDKK